MSGAQEPTRASSRSGVASASPPLQEQSMGELVTRISTDTSTLLRQELELAKVETKEEVSKAVRGAVGFGGAALTGAITLLLLAFAAAWGLAELIPVGFAFLAVAGAFLIITAALILTGRLELKRVTGPTRTAETLKEDVQWARDRMS